MYFSTFEIEFLSSLNLKLFVLLFFKGNCLSSDKMFKFVSLIESSLVKDLWDLLDVLDFIIETELK